MANALVSWLQLSAGAPAGQLQISWLQLSASAGAGQAQVSWLQLQPAGGGSSSLLCAAGSFAVDVASSIAIYALIAAAGALAVTGRAASLRRVGTGSAAQGQLDGGSTGSIHPARPAQLAASGRAAQLATGGRPAQ